MESQQRRLTLQSQDTHIIDAKMGHVISKASYIICILHVRMKLLLQICAPQKLLFNLQI